MVIESQVRDRVSQYLHGEIGLDSFEEWLVQRSWNMQQDSVEEARRLVAAIELRLAEHSSGHLDERGLRHELAGLVASEKVSDTPAILSHSAK
jgi:hypothetical protein